MKKYEYNEIFEKDSIIRIPKEGKPYSEVKRKKYDNYNQGKVTLKNKNNFNLSDIEYEINKGLTLINNGRKQDIIDLLNFPKDNVHNSFLNYSQEALQAIKTHCSISTEGTPSGIPRKDIITYLHIGEDGSGKSLSTIKRLYNDEQEKALQPITYLGKSHNIQINHYVNMRKELKEGNLEVNINAKDNLQLDILIDKLFSKHFKKVLRHITQGDNMETIISVYKYCITHDTDILDLSMILNEELEHELDELLYKFLSKIYTRKPGSKSKHTIEERILNLNLIEQKEIINTKSYIDKFLNINKKYKEFKENTINNLYTKLYDYLYTIDKGILKHKYYHNFELTFYPSNNYHNLAELISSITMHGQKDGKILIGNLIDIIGIYSTNSNIGDMEFHIDTIGFTSKGIKTFKGLDNYLGDLLYTYNPDAIIYNITPMVNTDDMVHVINYITSRGYIDDLYIDIGKMDKYIDDLADEIDEEDPEKLIDYYLDNYILPYLDNSLPKLKDKIIVTNKKLKTYHDGIDDNDCIYECIIEQEFIKQSYPKTEYIDYKGRLESIDLLLTSPKFMYELFNTINLEKKLLIKNINDLNQYIYNTLYLGEGYGELNIIESLCGLILAVLNKHGFNYKNTDIKSIIRTFRYNLSLILITNYSFEYLMILKKHNPKLTNKNTVENIYNTYMDMLCVSEYNIFKIIINDMLYNIELYL